MNPSERKFAGLLKELPIDWPEATPGFQLQLHSGGKKKLDVEFGKTHTYYDWASLTKIVATAPLMMRAMKAGGYGFDHDPAEEVAWIPKGYITLGGLMSHSNNLAWWKPFYKPMVEGKKTWKLKYSVEDAWPNFEKNLRRELKSEIAKGKVRGGQPCIYSDLDIFVLASWLCAVLDMPLHEIYLSHAESLELESLHYCVGNRPLYKRSLYAPTENSPERGGIQRGNVHDENTWGLGGVAPHAGLFGVLDDLSRYGLLLRQSIHGDKKMIDIPSAWVRRFAKRAVPQELGDWGSCFMLPTIGTASCGKFFSASSVGHTGFTGTSLWYDPKNDVLVTILSNRVCPTRENKLFLKLRPMLHETALRATNLAPN